MASYHHKGISRIEAEDLLLAVGKDGSFLVRDSETVQGAYTLCLLYSGVSKQYRILPGKNGLFVQAEEGVVNKSFSDLKQLIDSYSQRGDQNGLLCALKYPIPVQMAESDDEEEDPPSVCPPQPDNKTSTLSYLKYFKERSQQLDLSSVPGPFANALKLYAEDEVLIDRNSVNSGSDKPKKLQEIISMACEDLDKQLNTFLSQIELCKELFGPVSTQPPFPRSASMKKRDEDVISLFYKKLALCRTAVESLEKKAVNTLRCPLSTDLVEVPVDSPEGASVSSPPPVPPPISNARPGTRPQIPKKEYDVNLYKYGKAGTKLKVTVDVEQGKLYAVKEKGSQLDETNVFSSDQIQQLIKSSKDKCRLELKIVDRKSRDQYLFGDARERESFCQHIKQMKMLHSQYTEVSLIRVFVGTWNMAENQVPPNLNPWLRCQGLGKSLELQEVPHDVYVIGTQETTSSEWVKQIKVHLSNNYGVDFHLVASETLWQIRIIILVKPEYKDKISHIQSSTVATGIANKLGNKGGVAVSFTFNGTGFCFICGHLAARHDEKRNLKRHQNYRDIVKGLHLGPKYLQEVCDITKRFHHVFFFGDLNYRTVELEPELIISQVKCQKYEKLLEYDQLKTAQRKNIVLQGFKEEEITFPPTYRYQKGSRDQYAWEKVKKSGVRINAPSWCDRVLWRSYPDTHFESLAYGCVQDIVSSDHKPVFSSFEVALESQALPPKENSACGGGGATQILFEEMQARVRSHGKEAFKLEFHSSCLDKVVLSQRNSKSADPATGYNAPKWKKQDLPQLTPLFGTMDYLEGHHLIVAVKTDDGMESYGECVISLKSMIAAAPVSFNCELTHQGEATGRLWGKVYIRCQSYKREPRAVRAYEFVYMEDSATEERKSDTSAETGSLHNRKDLIRKQVDEHLMYAEPVNLEDQSSVQVKSESPDSNYSEPCVPTGHSVARNTTGKRSTANPLIYTEVNLQSKRQSRMYKENLSLDMSGVNSAKQEDTSSKSAGTKPSASALPKSGILSQKPTPHLPQKSAATPPLTSSGAIPQKPVALPPKTGTPPQSAGVLPPKSSAVIPTKSEGSQITAAEEAPPKLTTKLTDPFNLPSKSGALLKQSGASPPPSTLSAKAGLQPSVRTSPLPAPRNITRSGHPRPEEHTEEEEEIKPTLPPRRTTEEPTIPPRRTTEEPSLPPRRTTEEPTIPPRRTTEEPTIPLRCTKDEPVVQPKRSPPKPGDAGIMPPRPSERAKPSVMSETNNNQSAGKEAVKREVGEQQAASSAKEGKPAPPRWPQSMVGSLEDNPVYGEKESADLDEVDYGLLETPKEEKAPTLPPRRKYHEAKEPGYYDRLHMPESVEEWLQGLQLKGYASLFKQSGWDRIDYLEDMSRDDLKLMGITDPLLQTRVLTSIKDMKGK